MFKFIRLSVLAAIGIIFLFNGIALAAGGRNGGPSRVPLEDTQEIEDLKYLREEEKLARDVYLYFAEKYKKAVFSNIAESEQRHMDAVKTLLDRYGIEDPAAGNGYGVFDNPDLQDLYTALTEFPESKVFDDPLQGALYVGATIEDLDILDIQHKLDYTTEHDPTRYDLINVYTNLIEGSKNHLRAYCGLLETLYGYDYATGDRYFDEFLSDEQIMEILSSSKETGGM